MNKQYARQTRTIERNAEKEEIMYLVSHFPCSGIRPAETTNARLRFGKVVRDTIQYYGRWPVALRGTGKGGHCVYWNGLTKQTCAVGRLCTNPADIVAAGMVQSIVTLADTGQMDTLYSLMKPEYKFLSTGQLIALQSLHDTRFNWEPTEGKAWPNQRMYEGLTQAGRQAATAILIAAGYSYSGARAAVTKWCEDLELVLGGYESQVTHWREPFAISLLRAKGELPGFRDAYIATQKQLNADARASNSGPISMSVSLPDGEKSN